MRSEALKKAQKKYYEKNKNTEKYKSKVKEYQAKNKLKYNTNEDYRKKRQEYQKNYYYENLKLKS